MIFCFKTYSGAHINWHELVLAGNQDIHKNLVSSMLTYNLIFMKMKQKKFFLKKRDNGQPKKLNFQLRQFSISIFCENFSGRSFD